MEVQSKRSDWCSLLVNRFGEYSDQEACDLGVKKMCFKNAADAVIFRSDKAEPSQTPYYVEGYALTPDQPPFYHAWIAIEGKYAVELTLRHAPKT